MNQTSIQGRIFPAGRRQFLLMVTLLGAMSILAWLCVADRPELEYSIFNRTWGFDNLRFISREGSLFCILLLLLALMPRTHTLAGNIPSIAEKRAGLLDNKLTFAGLALLGFWFFYSNQVRLHLLGDLTLRMLQTIKGEYVETEFFTMVLLHHLANLAGKAGVAPEVFFRTYSCFAGAVYVYIACLIARECGESALRKVFYFLSLLCTSALLMFCGYVEVYATPAVLLMLYILGMIRYLKNRSGLLRPVLFLTLAVASHLINAAAIPSLFVALYFRRQDSFGFIRKSKPEWVLAGLLALMALALITVFSFGGGFVMPLRKVGTQFGFLSLKHIWESLNGQILSSGLNLFVTIAILLSMLKRKETATGLQVSMLSISGSFLLLVLVSNLQRGSGDWDIMAFPSIPLNLLTALLCLQRMKTNGAYLLFFLVTFNAINAFTWIRIHHGNQTIAKTESMLGDDPASYYHARISGRVQMGLVLKENGFCPDAERICMKECDRPGLVDMRSCLIVAECMRRQDRMEEAALLYEWMLNTKTPLLYEAYLFLLEHYEKKNDGAKVLEFLEKLFAAFNADRQAFLDNVNFRNNVMYGLLEVLYQMRKEQAEPAYLNQIRNTQQFLQQRERAEKK